MKQYFLKRKYKKAERNVCKAFGHQKCICKPIDFSVLTNKKFFINALKENE